MQKCGGFLQSAILGLLGGDISLSGQCLWEVHNPREVMQSKLSDMQKDMVSRQYARWATIALPTQQSALMPKSSSHEGLAFLYTFQNIFFDLWYPF
jgi:hypothetical protein